MPIMASRPIKEAVAAVHAAKLRRRARSGHGGQSLHRLEDRAGHAAGGVHQPGRRDADDRARLSGGRHAHQILRRRRCIACRSWPQNDFFPDLDPIPADVRRRAKLLVLVLSEQPDGQSRHARFLQARDRLRAEARTARRGAGRRPRHAELRRAAAELPAVPGRRKSASKSIRCPRVFT